MKCVAKLGETKKCRYYTLPDSSFCKCHQYLTNYSEDQLDRLTACRGCKKYLYIENGDRCPDCILCAHEKCNSKKSETNSYCIKHQICVWLDEVKANDQVPCVQYIRGCRNVLEMGSSYKKCDSCRTHERQKDQNKREHAKKENELNAPDSTTKCCTVCGKRCPISDFVGERTQVTSTCLQCRNDNKNQDAKRDKEHRRVQGRIYDAKESRKRRKKEWQSENWDKVVTVWRNYRKRQREKNERAYLNRNANNAREWRANNPDAMEAQHKRMRESLDCQYRIYIQSAKHRNIEFGLDFNTYRVIVENPCYYCGCINENRGFHGIDRKESTAGYTHDNCVACCSMCNYIKGTIPEIHFLQRIETVLAFNNLIENGKSYMNSSKNYNVTGASYGSYLHRATKKSIEFHLTSEQFNALIQEKCYLCGKENTNNHCNGVDRVDNSIGYTIENARSCCGGCNYMKSDYSLDGFKIQLLKIYNNWISKSLM